MSLKYEPASEALPQTPVPEILIRKPQTPEEMQGHLAHKKTAPKLYQTLNHQTRKL